MAIPIYTIGYGNRSIEEFIELLQRYEIQFLLDIRSHPSSRFNPKFSKEVLEKLLKQQHIRYVFMGDTLGGRPSDRTCYDLDGRVDYAKLRQKEFYQQGISRIQTAWEKQLHVALMCSERKPQECHRSKLIGNSLTEHSIEVAHIDEGGKVKTQAEVNGLLIGDQPSLFDLEQPITVNKKIAFSRKRYMQSNEQGWNDLPIPAELSSFVR